MDSFEKQRQVNRHVWVQMIEVESFAVISSSSLIG